MSDIPPVKEMMDMRTYLARKDIANETTTNQLPPRQEMDICDQCGDIVSTVVLTRCPYCDIQVCGTSFYCLHYCKKTIKTCRFDECDKILVVNQVYCSLSHHASMRNKLRWNKND